MGQVTGKLSSPGHKRGTQGHLTDGIGAQSACPGPEERRPIHRHVAVTVAVEPAGNHNILWWLASKDSNLGPLIQNQVPYRLATRQ